MGIPRNAAKGNRVLFAVSATFTCKEKLMAWKFMVFCALAGLFGCLSATVARAADAVAPAVYTVGKAKVTAIQDIASDRDISVFRGMSEEELRKIAPKGSVPSSATVFLVQYADQAILLDTGYGRKDSNLLPALKGLGLGPDDITAVVITHMHGDHIGGLLLPEGGIAFPKARIFIAEPEIAFWTNQEHIKQYPHRERNFVLAKSVADAYGAKIATFTPGTKVLAFDSLFAPGHTPGHTVFTLASDNQRMLFVADIVHGAAIQFPNPKVSVTYDLDMDEAAKSRIMVIEKALAESLPIAGTHHPFPSVGVVAKGSGAEAYTYATIQPGAQ